MNTYEIVRKLNKTKRRYVYYPTVNGTRITKTNWARKYDARGCLRRAIKLYGEQKLHDLSSK